jgi:hypothetical protein
MNWWETIYYGLEFIPFVSTWWECDACWLVKLEVFTYLHHWRCLLPLFTTTLPN